jgi:hypothetical protein
MNNTIPFPHMIEIVTSDAETLWINVSNIDKISYARQNANWCYVYLKDSTTPFILKNTPDEFYEIIIQSYLNLKSKYGL